MELSDSDIGAVDEVVLKQYKKVYGDGIVRSKYMVDLQVQTVAAALADNFTSQLSRTTADPGVKLKFLMAKLAKVENYPVPGKV